VVDEREDEVSDQADKLNPILDVHRVTSFLRGKEPTHQTAYRAEYNSFRKFSSKNFERQA